MKTALRKSSVSVRRCRISTNLLIAVFVCVVCEQASPVMGQAILQLPTRFAIQDRVPDFTVFEDLARNVGGFHNVLAGDFNGDGVGDLLITNSLGLGSSSQVGKAYVILGKSSLGLQKAINLATEQPDLTILGPAEFSQLGISATTGDLNGDGIDDIFLVVNTVLTPRGLMAGAIYVILGSRTFSTRVIDLAHNHADLTVFGGSVFEQLGPGLAVGDINGDGSKDLIFRQNSSTAENVVSLLGPLTAGTVVDLATASADIVIRGAPRIDGFGNQISAADVNGDETTDVIIGTPAGRGTVYVFMGSTVFKKGVTISLTQAQSDATIQGAFAGSDFGLGDALGGVISIGDVNGDGIPDILLGVPASLRLGNGPGPTSAGETYIVFGSRSLAGRSIDTGLGQQDLTIQGTAATVNTNSGELGDSLGASIVARDIDGDGVADLLIGAYGAGLKDFGEAYVVLGSSELISGGVIKTSEGDQDITISGQEKQAHLGTRVASGDLNGDGISDLILEAAKAETPGGSQQGTGAIYIYFGAKVRPPEITKAKFKEGKSQLQIIGSELTGDVRVEINGVLIDREVAFVPNDGRLILKGTRQELNLSSNPNQVVVIRKGARSNVAKVKGG